MPYKAATSTTNHAYLQSFATLTPRRFAFPILQVLLRWSIVLAGLCAGSPSPLEADVPGIDVSQVHAFEANEGRPRAGVILAPDGKLYGTTDCKKDSSKNIVFGGTVYQIDPLSKQLVHMHDFSLLDNNRH